MARDGHRPQMPVRAKNSVWGEAIGRQLREAGLTQTELARLAGISRGTVLHILRGGHCHTETLERIANAFGMPLADLFQEPVDIGIRRDKVVAAVLRELSETIGEAVDEHLSRRRLLARRRKRADTRLPFTD
jgi:transcriptional regulator with XRE-family HTH domain